MRRARSPTIAGKPRVLDRDVPWQETRYESHAGRGNENVAKIEVSGPIRTNATAITGAATCRVGNSDIVDIQSRTIAGSVARSPDDRCLILANTPSENGKVAAGPLDPQMMRHVGLGGNVRRVTIHIGALPDNDLYIILTARR